MIVLAVCDMVGALVTSHETPSGIMAGRIF